MECEEGLEFGKISAISSCHGIKDLNVQRLEVEADKDERYKELHRAVVNGFSDFHSKYGTWTKQRKYRYIREF